MVVETIANNMSKTIQVDVWSDIACPWCYIGKHRFEAGIEKFRQDHPDVEISVVSHSFELAPDTPTDFAGSEIDFLVNHKGMSRDQVEAMLNQMRDLAASEGIEFNFDRLRHTNTHRSHRVLHLAKAHGLQAEMKERLFRAYFTEGAEVSNPETLADLGEEVGLNRQEVIDAFNDDAYGTLVENDISRARELGINGVPFFLLEEKYGVSGAQTPDVFADVLARVTEMSQGTAATKEEA